MATYCVPHFQCVCSGVRTYIFYNDAFRPSLGADGKHPAVGKLGSEVWSDTWTVISPLLEQVFSSGRAVWFEDRLIPINRNSNLEDVYWTFSYSPALGDSGNIEGILVNCIETTEKVIAHKRIEEKVAQRTRELESAHNSLMQANVYLQDIINLFKEPLQVLEPVVEKGHVIDFCYKLTNAAYSSYANTTPKDLQNKKVSEFFPGYFQTSSFSKISEVFQTGIAETWEIHYNVDGLNLFNQMSATKLGNEVVVHFTDFTNLKNLQLELEQKIAELEASNQLLEEFTYGASHDLKEPIRKIQIFIALLKDQLISRLKEQEAVMFNRVENTAKRMELLVDDMLVYSGLGHQAYTKESVNLNDKLGLVLEDLDLAIQQKAAVIHLSNLPTILGYRRQIQQMLQNLVSNALKYSNPSISPIIHIKSTEVIHDENPFHRLEIQDNGIGFDPRYAEKIFGMFTRLHNKDQYTGSGVGLAIVKKIVENHNGMIEAESIPGKGSTFKVWLPVNNS